MRVFRLCRAHHGDTRDRLLNGVGAYLVGGRWNPKGYYVTYTSETTALALLEVLAHADLEDLPDDLVVASVHVPDNVSEASLKADNLPKDWREVDPAPTTLQEIGRNWVMRAEALLLRVPSVIVPDEYHVLINPKHPEVRLINEFQVQSFTIDPRLGVGL